MKKYLIIILLIALTTSLYAQTKKVHSLGARFSYGKSSYSKSKLKPSAENDYKGRDYFTFELDYSRQIAAKTDLCVGLSAALYRMDLSNIIYKPGWTNTHHYNDSFGIFALPISVKYRFWKFLYLQPGISFNYHPYHGYSWGLGAFASLGAEYIMKSGIAFSIAPEAKTNLLSLGKTGNDDNNFSSGFDERLTQFGINIGIGYRF